MTFVIMTHFININQIIIVIQGPWSRSHGGILTERSIHTALIVWPGRDPSIDPRTLLLSGASLHVFLSPWKSAARLAARIIFRAGTARIMHFFFPFASIFKCRRGKERRRRLNLSMISFPFSSGDPGPEKPLLRNQKEASCFFLLIPSSWHLEDQLMTTVGEGAGARAAAIGKTL